MQHAVPSVQVGYLRRGRYNKGKRVGKAVMLQAVRLTAPLGCEAINATYDYVWAGQGCSGVALWAYMVSLFWHAWQMVCVPAKACCYTFMK